MSDSDSVLIWEWPHRLWHWAFVGAIGVSLYTGLADDLELMDLHITTGVGVIGLLGFRLGWALWGGRYVRAKQYRTSPVAIWRHLRGQPRIGTAHSAPGAAMALAIFTAVCVQVGSGLFASDDIFTDGPFAHYLDDAGVDLATAIHTRMYWIVLTLIVVHLSAVGWYTWRRDPIAQSMLHGRAPLRVAPITRHYSLRAAMTAVGAAALLWAADRYF